jgi:phosphate transport system permease protein
MMTVLQNIETPEAMTPWRNRSAKKLSLIAVASITPVLLTFIIASNFEIPGLFALVLVFLPLQLVVASLAALFVAGKRGVSDALLTVVILFLMGIMVALLGSTVVSLAVKGGKALSFHALYQNSFSITSVTSIDYGGLGHAALGTLIVVGIAVVLAVPTGIAVGVFLTETRSPFNEVIRFLSQSLSGLPSIVSGLFIFSLLFLTGLIQRSAILGSLALFLLMLPTIIRLSEDVLKQVPQELRFAALALGAPRHKAFFQVVFPAARSGIVTTCLLGTARIIGETAPLIAVVTYVPTTNFNPVSGDMATLPTYIFTWLRYSTEFANQRAWGGALTLMILVGVLFTLARFFGRKRI